METRQIRQKWINLMSKVANYGLIILTMMCALIQIKIAFIGNLPK